MSTANNILLFFIFQGHNIRVVIHDGEPWFVARDVCEVLEIGNASLAINGNPSRHETGLDEDEKGIFPVNTLGGPQATLCVNEPGIYRLIARSHKPEAKPFQRWVYHEVLPSIRKTGSYSLPQQEPQEPSQRPSQETDLRMHLLSLSKEKLGDELRDLRTALSAIETTYHDSHPCLTLAKDTLRGEIHYLRALLAAVETVYNNKYPQEESRSQQVETVYNNKYPQEESRLQQVETLVLHPVETRPDLQTVLLDYLRKVGSVTVRYLQQSGPRSLRNLPADQLRAMLQALLEEGLVKVVQNGKLEEYQLV